MVSTWQLRLRAPHSIFRCSAKPLEAHGSPSKALNPKRQTPSRVGYWGDQGKVKSKARVGVCRGWGLQSCRVGLRRVKGYKGLRVYTGLHKDT